MLEEFIRFIGEGDILSLFLKLFGVVLSALYIAFSGIIIVQIKAMIRSIPIREQSLLLFIAYLQLILSVVALLFALFIL